MRKPFAFPTFVVAVVAMLGLMCASLFGFVPVTPMGVQCPTATVQTVSVRDCCGHLVVRAPKPGEKAFMQCRCAEKKSAAHEATAPAKVSLFFVANEPVVIQGPTLAPRSTPAFVASYRSVGFPPSVRPPTAA